MPDAWITASWDFSKIQSTIYAYLAIPGKKLNNLKKYFVNIAMIPWTLINVLNVGKEASYKYRIKMVKFQIQANVKILAHQDNMKTAFWIYAKCVMPAANIVISQLIIYNAMHVIKGHFCKF